MTEHEELYRRASETETVRRAGKPASHKRPCIYCGVPTVELDRLGRGHCYSCTLSLRVRPFHTEARGRSALAITSAYSEMQTDGDEDDEGNTVGG